MSSNADYTYSYSGSDCDAYAFFPGSEGLREYINFYIETQRESQVSFERNLAQPRLNQTNVDRSYQSFTESSAEAEFKQKVSIRNQSSQVQIRDSLKVPLKVDANFFSPVKMTQMATISISIHEAKSPVRRIGERGVSGYTRGIRTIAGTIVFLVIEDHPLRMLAAKDPANIYSNLVGWSRDLTTKGVGSGHGGNKIKFDNKISTLISPMNIMLRYQTEVARNGQADPGASMILEGVEFVNEGIVTSVNDMVTEVVCQFVAQDIRPFTDLNQSNSTEIIEAYESNRGSQPYESYYRSLINKHKSNQPARTPNQFGSVEVSFDDYSRG
jgi:hypothetical protein